MFGKRQILIGLCAVVLSGSVIASDNSSALHGQDNAQTCVKPFGNLSNIPLNPKVTGSVNQDDWELRFKYLKDLDKEINFYLPLISLTEMENALYAGIRASQNGVAIGELERTNVFTRLAGIPNDKPTIQWTLADKVKFYLYHTSLGTYYTNPVAVLFDLYGIRRLRYSFNLLQLQGQVTLDDLMTDTEASTDQE